MPDIACSGNRTSSHASQTHLAAGTTSYSVLVFYGRTIDPITFQAKLEGMDISSRFHPVPGTNERVMIPLVPGRNLLHLSVDGDIGSRFATDTDRLVFVIP